MLQTPRRCRASLVQACVCTHTHTHTLDYYNNPSTSSVHAANITLTFCRHHVACPCHFTNYNDGSNFHVCSCLEGVRKGSKTCCARWHLWSCRQRNPQEEQMLQQGQQQEQEELLLLPEQVPPPPPLHPRMIRTPVPAPSLRPHLQVDSSLVQSVF